MRRTCSPVCSERCAAIYGIATAEPDSRMLELRVATDLVRLWHGSPNHPRALLERILGVIEVGKARGMFAAPALCRR